MRKELTTTGEIIDYTGVVERIDDHRAFLIELFSQNNYLCNILNNDGCKWAIEILNPLIDFNKKYNVFIGNIRNEERNEKEKKIQLSSKDPRVIEDGYENIVLGVYCFNSADLFKDLIIAAWSISENTNYPTNPSIRGINIDLFQQAKFQGFVSNRYSENIVCCFRPEFIYYYLNNKDGLHSSELESNPTLLRISDYPYNLIYFGAPGTGKSHAISAYTTDANSIKITFHPDIDYANFIGSYKPIQREGETTISYGFVAQAFLQAYLKSWETEDATFLIIEEINRGNCAQIFGDIFQVIERGENGYSKYSINVDTELEKYLKTHFDDLVEAGGTEAVKAQRYLAHFTNGFSKLELPNNFFIHATMNTSDQSLFPIDSAFKRRWDWEFVPIEFENTDAKKYLISVDGVNYKWRSFIEAINKKIELVTDSEDKMLGQFFIKAFDNTISEKTFKAKVMFYLWNDVLKDEVKTDERYFFRSKANATDVVANSFSFSELFAVDSSTLLKNFMTYLEIIAEQ